MRKYWLVGLIVLVGLVFGPYKLLYLGLFVLLPIYCSIPLIERSDLDTFQRVTLLLLTWFVPLIGPIASFYVLKNVLPPPQTE